MRLARSYGEGAPEAAKPLAVERNLYEELCYAAYLLYAAVESNLYEECYATYLLYAAILCAYSNRYGEGERERELSSTRSGVMVYRRKREHYRRKREHYGWTFRYRRLVPRDRYTFPLVSRPMFFVAPEDHYSPMAEHITTDIKEVPSDALLPSKIEVNPLATDAKLAEMLGTVSPRPMEGKYERGDSTLSI